MDTNSGSSVQNVKAWPKFTDKIARDVTEKLPELHLKWSYMSSLDFYRCGIVLKKA